MTLAINWVDLLVLFVLISIIASSKSKGFVVEFISFLGVYMATILSLHYFIRFGKFLGKNVLFFDANQYGVAFVILTLLPIFIFAAVASGWKQILNINPDKSVDKYAGIFLGALRGYLICSLILIGLMLSGRKEVARKVHTSASHTYVSKASVNIYKVAYDHMISSFFPNEPLNKSVTRIYSQKKSRFYK